MDVTQLDNGHALLSAYIEQSQNNNINAAAAATNSVPSEPASLL